ncbi:MAG: amino acid ABC transporter permease [Limnobacter sp.]|nr:amino acid ABC transporter permease [Limnobacter sp.]
MVRGGLFNFVGILIAAIFAIWALDWAVWSAVFEPSLQACKAAAGEGACWGVVAEKWRLILFGRYPAEQIWRPITLTVIWTLLLWATVAGHLKPKVALPVWLVWVPAAWLMMSAAPTNLWGGLPLTLMISCLGIALAFPLGVLLALGRRSESRWISTPCVIYIETLRALPLVSILFLAAFVLPLVLPAALVGDSKDLLARVIVTIAFFSAAYQAEVIRGGLQTLSNGQSQAAKALGLRWDQTQWNVVLPQAIKACLPGLTNSFITLFKECSLVTVVSLFELTGALGLALSGDVQWRQYYLEGYLFIAGVYWVYCYGLSRYAK